MVTEMTDQHSAILSMQIKYSLRSLQQMRTQQALVYNGPYFNLSLVHVFLLDQSNEVCI